MLEYINFCLIFALILYLYFRMKRYLPLLKMAEEELIGNLGFNEPPQLDSKRQKLLECILTGNSKLYLHKVYTEKIKELKEEEIEKLLNDYEAKLSGQMVKSDGKVIWTVNHKYVFNGSLCNAKNKRSGFLK